MSCFSFFSNSKSNVNPFLDPPFSSPTSTYIPSKVNEKVSITESTGEKLTLLRSELKRLQLDCYLIPTSDSHASEYVGDSDKRRSWISGFNGSAGIAIVCLNKAVMFVDCELLCTFLSLSCLMWLLLTDNKHVLQPDTILKLNNNSIQIGRLIKLV